MVWSVPKVDLHVLERTLLDAAATLTGWLHAVAAVRRLDTLTAHAGVAAVEDGRRLGAGCPAAPVPVLVLS